MTDIPVLFDSREALREVRRLARIVNSMEPEIKRFAAAVADAEMGLYPPSRGDVVGRGSRPESSAPPGDLRCATALRNAVSLVASAVEQSRAARGLVRAASGQLEAVCRPRTTLDDMAKARRDEQKQARKEQRIRQEQTAKWAGKIA